MHPTPMAGLQLVSPAPSLLLYKPAGVRKESRPDLLTSFLRDSPGQAGNLT